MVPRVKFAAYPAFVGWPDDLIIRYTGRMNISPKIFKDLWLYALVGGLVGFGYVVLDEGVLDASQASGGLIAIVHELVDAVVPVLLGITTALGIGVLRRLSRLNERLSLKKERLEKELLFSTLISQMLHEIQNPIHNISAVFEDSDKHLDEEKTAIIRRNLQRLAELRKQYGERYPELETLETESAVPFKKWLDALVEDKLRSQLDAMGIRYQTSLSPVKIKVHSILLEQAALTLFSNAFEALESVPREKREIHVSVRPENGGRTVELVFRNTGAVFPEPVLEAQAKNVAHSRHGLGLGLLLLHRMIEQVGGTMRLENEQGRAKVTLTLPGGPE